MFSVGNAGLGEPVAADIQGLAGGDMAKALAGASAPYLAEVIHNMTTDPVTGKVNTEANLMAHAVLGAVMAQVNGNNALSGASGALMGEFIAQQLYPDIPRNELSEEQKQTISALGTLAAGLAGGLTGDSTADAVAGAQAGKNALENNNLNLGSVLPSGLEGTMNTQGSLWFNTANLVNEKGEAIPGLTFEEQMKMSSELYLGPSGGTTYKVKPYAKVDAAGGLGPAGFAEATIDPNQLLINGGMTSALGVKGSATVGLTFGPYFPGVIGSPDKSYSFDLGLGYGTVGMSAGKDGVGLSFGVGPSFGWAGFSKQTPFGEIDMNGSTSSEIYKHDFEGK